MANKNNNLNHHDTKYMRLAYEQALINLGSTATNPSVGCVVVKSNSIISSGCTSLNGRPHAENNALKKKINFKGSDIYISLEPCSHYGKTPPCVDKIINKEIKRVIFSINDSDPRSKEKAKKKLNNKKIKVRNNVLNNFGKEFYHSYFLQLTDQLPHIDAKLAISKDSYTINRKERWITNSRSRKIGNFMRSKYDCLVTTSQTINDDNPYLDCRIEGLEKKSPDLIIIDRTLNLKKNSRIFKKKNRKIYLLTTSLNKNRENSLKKKGVKIIKFLQKKNSSFDLKNIFYIIKKLGFNRILIESGITFLNKLLRHNLIKNFYLFKSSKSLRRSGYNNFSLLDNNVKISIKNKIKVNLDHDILYKVKL